MTVAVEDLAENLVLEGGVYYPDNISSDKIHYPDSGYDNLLELEENSFWFNHRNQCVYDLVKIYSPNETFIDIGGGSGSFVNYMVKQGMDAVLIEPGETGAWNASQRGLKSICAKIQDVKFKPAVLKALGLFDVVEHIEDDRSFLQQIYSLMADSGHLYITVPAYSFLWSDDDRDAGHFRRYSLKQMESLLEELGFKVQFASYYFLPLILPIYLFRVLPSLLGFRKTDNETNVQEHNAEGLLPKFIAMILAQEAKLIKQRHRLPLGASIIVVAQKPLV